MVNIEADSAQPKPIFASRILLGRKVGTRNFSSPNIVTIGCGRGTMQLLNSQQHYYNVQHNKV